MKSIAVVLMLAVPVMAQSIDKKSATEKSHYAYLVLKSGLPAPENVVEILYDPNRGGYASVRVTNPSVEYAPSVLHGCISGTDEGCDWLIGDGPTMRMFPCAGDCIRSSPTAPTQADIQRLEKRIAELEKKLALVTSDGPKKPVMVDLAAERCYGRLKNSPEEFCWEVYPDGRNCTRHYDKSGKENGLTCVKAAK